MEDLAEVKSWQSSTTVFVGCYIVMLLLSLDGFYSAEVAARNHGWYMKFVIAIPWGFAFIAGVAMLIAPKRKKFNAQAAGAAMFIVGFLVSAAYEGMGKLAGLIH